MDARAPRRARNHAASRDRTPARRAPLRATALAALDDSVRGLEITACGTTEPGVVPSGAHVHGGAPTRSDDPMAR